ncbi:MAG: 30S ribosomal protein S3 [Elusimicrobiales bacterium]|nr:30S ribosomal protein S3 [Elusimicrobiales bacterium]
MGQKIHPNAVRLGYIREWQSRWVSDIKDMPQLIREDYDIRSIIKERFFQAAISSITIERLGSYIKITIHTARPGLVIGRKGQDIENLKNDLEKMTNKKVYINVHEIKVPELDANLVAQAIASQLEKRASYKKVCKRAMDKTMASGALGIKVMVSGRLGGAEIARREWYRRGRVPLQTFAADVDYGFAEANTIMGKIGVKVWIFKKLHFAKTPRELQEELRKLRLEEEKEMILDSNLVNETSKDKGDSNVNA